MHCAHTSSHLRFQSNCIFTNPTNVLPHTCTHKYPHYIHSKRLVAKRTYDASTTPHMWYSDINAICYTIRDDATIYSRIYGSIVGSAFCDINWQISLPPTASQTTFSVKRKFVALSFIRISLSRPAAAERAFN